MLRLFLQKVGVFGGTAAFTGASVILSILITSTISMVARGEIDRVGIFIAIVAPAVIAPIFAYVQFSLLAKLDVAERRLRELSTIDDLTGVFNRRGILELADMEIARAKRLLHPMSVALLDIDNFKKINDVYGHAAGDLVLQRLAELCKKNIREIDRFARYGGEEFVFILPEANSMQATEFTDRIRKLIENSAVEYDNQTIRFSVSIGVASLSDGEDLEKLMLRSDNALYKAKRQGKNVTVCAEAV